MSIESSRSSRSGFELRAPAILATLFALVVFASPSFAATAAKPVAPDSLELKPLAQVSAWAAPQVDVERLLQEDEAGLSPKDAPYRIGYPMKTDLSPANSGTWETLKDGARIWRLSVFSEGALWIVLGFDLYRLPEGASLFLYDPALKTVAGPYTARDVRDHGQLWSPPIETDTLVVELYWPEKLAGAQPDLHLGTVSHGYKPFGTIGLNRMPEKAYGDSGSCNIDVACPEAAQWQDQKRGGVILLSGGSGFCSGSLINTTANDCRPYVLTAAHCTAGVSTVFGFNFERPGCNSGTPPPETTQIVTGATVLGNYTTSDFTLLQMNASPPEAFNVYYSGWNRATTPATETHVIHHPSGDAKKIAYDADPPVDGSHYGANHWRIEQYTWGTTEPGSSGSPLFDQNHRIIGQLHGGTASCTSITYDEYGKVDASWVGGGTAASRLSDWLDPNVTGEMFMDGVNWAICAFNPAGTVTFARDTYACTDTLSITVRDDNLQGNPTQIVGVVSTREAVSETVTLSALEPGSGFFTGTFPVASVTPVHGDGKLSVNPGDTVTVTYIDADDGGGGTNVPRTATAQIDCTGPAIAGVHSQNVTGNRADIFWNTDEASNSTVIYDTAFPPTAGTASSAAMGVTHQVTVTGLSACSHYYYAVRSTDAAGNTSTDTNGGSFYTFITGVNVNPTYPATDVPVAIPDNNTTGGTSTINVTDNKPVQNVTVKVNITHSYDADLVLHLIGPDSTDIVLSNGRGTGGDNFTNTIFDDAASTPIASGTAPFAGSFRPDTPLATFIGKNSMGPWKLKVVDTANIDTGSITGWDLVLTYPTQSCGSSLEYQSAQKNDTCNGSGTGGANGVIEPGETVVMPVTAHANGTSGVTGVSATLTSTTPGVTITDGFATFADMGAGGTAMSDPNHFEFQVDPSMPCGTSLAFNIAFTADQGSWSSMFTLPTGTPGITTNTHVSTDIPKPIADNATIQSLLPITSTETVLDVNVNLSVTHTFDGDLTLTLIGPTGTRVALSNRNGSSGNDYTNTTFDDAAATPIASGTAPFTGTFKPEAPLAGLNGIPANGTWKLEVQDSATIDTGALTGWSITLTTTSTPSCLNCTPAFVGEATNLLWLDKDTLQWSAAANATSYCVYRGDPSQLPNLLTAAVDSCSRLYTPSTDSGDLLAETPPAGTVNWYLVVGLNVLGEGSAGHATACQRVLNSEGACP